MFIKFELMMSKVNIYGQGCENNCFFFLFICDPFYCNGYSGAFRLDCTAAKKANVNKSPCGHISQCPSQSLELNDVRMIFVLLLGVPRSYLFKAKVFEF